MIPSGESKEWRGKIVVQGYETQTTMYKIEKATRIYCAAQGDSGAYIIL